jgi:SAM-dependent methyltransferase
VTEFGVPDEIASAGPEHLDAGYVAAYDVKAAFDPGPDLAVLSAHGLDAESTLVDLGAGTGTFAVAAAPLCRYVTAVDTSPAMLDAARRKAELRGAANVRCVQAGFLSYEHQGPAASFVYTRNALHHLPDFWKSVALCRIAALLTPGGALRLRDVAYSFEPSEADARLAAWFDAAAEDTRHGWTRAELEEHVRDEHSTFTWLLEPMLVHAGFEIAAAEHDEGGIYAAYLCVKRAKE